MSDFESVVAEIGACAEKRDFAGALALVKENRDALGKRIQGIGVKEALKKTTDDRLLLSLVDGAEFETRPLDKALVRLEKLLSFQKDSRVLNATWGLGKVTRIDYFYRRITVDFRTRKGHQFTYAAAADMLERAPENHILVLRESDPARVEAMLKDDPAAFVKAVLKSYGDMPIVKLEDICRSNGFVKPDNWKKFWEAARADLRKDKLVTIPVKRTEPLQLRESVEDYGDSWLTNFCHETSPKLILAAVREFVAQGRFQTASADVKARLEERLEFAVTAARMVDDALYARLACQVAAMGFAKPPADEMRAYLWERKRFVKAAAALPAREVGAMLTFLAVDDAARAKLYAHLDEFCFAAVSEVVSQFGADPACRAAVGALMRQPKAPATLTTLIVGRYETFCDWTELPALITLLMHAIALGEGRQNGETLKMQNIVRRLFSDVKWLEKVFNWLDAAGRVMFFERFQASIAWDPSTHHTAVVRMARLAPDLEAHLVRAEKKKEYARLTSWRSFALRKADYLKLINEEMPANVKRIEEAKSYGDLSENAEYQYAKDEQRALMQKQAVMQEELEAVKPGDFADATTDEVMPGVTVVVEAPEGERTYHVLGEWDNDVERGILSSKTRLAQNMLGKKAGDEFELPGTEGASQFARIVRIEALSDEIRAWMKLPDGMQI
jgi:transcription elongation GreA/GreB family factor